MHPDRRCGFELEGSQMSDSVGMYLNEIGAVPLLDADDERTLAQAIEDGAEARRRKDAG
ncbi:MAG: hypothetical protein M5U19_23525 [Microthrixaceae bacterium]|nr:hypothetical protein [Microthrixaceae bacterium]